MSATVTEENFENKMCFFLKKNLKNKIRIKIRIKIRVKEILYENVNTKNMNWRKKR
jgi:hypothetical protein